ncbi:SOS response-associated peptidase family protein [Burkholderia ambifaria]|uniref:SOS response-associated peptidase family protein n=1 Tax=Burkholderia ambifaria TaxID=152480 RepID=UPI002FE40F3A
MCTNYRAPGEEAGMSELRVDWSRLGEWDKEVYRDYLAPVVFEENGERRAELAHFSFVPAAFIHPSMKGMSTMNARAETVGQKVNYKRFWLAGQRALIPAAWFYEPKWTPDDKSQERWRIGLSSGEPFAIAGMWRTWPGHDGSLIYAMTMITVNCDDHPLLNQFHRHFDKKGNPEEKRTPVIVRPADYDAWFNAKNPEEARQFFTLLAPDELHAEAAPKPRKSRGGETAQLI